MEARVNPTTHHVEQGETLYAIAKRYDLQVMELATANDLKLEEGIKPSQVLKIPDNQIIAKERDEVSKVAGYTLHEVKSSETLYSVARKYGVTIKDLMEWNNKSDFSVSVGEQLRIQEK